MTKLYILQEIKRTTQANGGTPLRKIQFESETGIKRFDWFGRILGSLERCPEGSGLWVLHHVQAADRRQLSRPLSYDRSRASPSVPLM